MTMSGTIKAGLLLLLSSVILMSCKDVRADDKALMQYLGIEKKYYLRVGFESHAARANLRTRSMTEAA